ncbi:toxin TcdB middle/C-terminal domain-containing protein, partial [Klebsiella pneumoniae]|uniref:toxin TcdB middle/C-terminal domain-containing protein n=1 Tax=Klebsiella pneumoniae TaxID=573 RepID=UPI00351D01AB
MPCGASNQPDHWQQAYQYEQDATDPMCQKTLSLAWDEFGNLTQGVAVAYARRLTAADD